MAIFMYLGRVRISGSLGFNKVRMQGRKNYENLVNFAIIIYRAGVCRALSTLGKTHSEITQNVVAKCIKLKAEEFNSVIGLFVILNVSSKSDTNNQQLSFSYTVRVRNGTLKSERERQTAAQMSRTSASVSVIHV